MYRLWDRIQYWFLMCRWKVCRDVRSREQAKIGLLREIRDKLPERSHVRQAISDEVIAELQDQANTLSVAELETAPWLYICSAVLGWSQEHGRHTAEVIASLDDDIDAIISQGSGGCGAGIVGFLRARKEKRPGQFYGGLFDIWAKAQAIEACPNAALDVPLPNGRNHDILIEVRGKPIHIEATVITGDDEAREVYKAFLKDKAHNPSAKLQRPGRYCPPDAKGPSLYYDCLRVYGKIFDKLMKDLDDAKTQCHPAEPNVLLLSFSGPGVSPRSPGVGWALDELFADQGRFSGRLTKSGIKDISLDAWIEFTADRLFGQLDDDEWNKRFDRVIGASKKLGGVILFDGSTLTDARINYNADDGQRISSAQMAELEAIFSRASPYLRQSVERDDEPQAKGNKWDIHALLNRLQLGPGL